MVAVRPAAPGRPAGRAGPRRRPPATAAWLLVAVAVGTAPARAQVPAPERFSLVLWSGDQARGIAVAKAVGADALQLPRGGDPAPLRAAGLGFYVDQPIGKGLLELRDADWNNLRAAYERDRDVAALLRPTCLGDAAGLGAASQQLTTELQRIGAAGVRFVALADEPSATRHDAPLDTCACAGCRAGFRAFLQRRWPTLDAQNVVLGTTFANLDDVLPPSTDQVRRRELGDVQLPADLRPFVLRQSFVAEQYVTAVRRLAAAARQALPDVPIGLTGLQVPAAFGGNDYARLLPELTLLEPYDLGGALELAAAFGARGAHRYTTLFPPPVAPGQASLSPTQHVRAALSRAASLGQAGIVVWNDATVADPAGQPTPFGAALAAELPRWRAVLDACAGATTEPSPVWILESQTSVTLWWMLDSAQDGMTWVRRLSSYERTHSTSQAARRSWLRLLGDLGHEPRFVGEHDLAERLLLERPRCLILPATLALGERNAQAIAAYARAGGTVLADHSTGLYDDQGLRRDRGALDELFGVTERSLRWDDLLVREGRALQRLGERLPAGERGLRGRLGERRDDTTVFVEQSLDRGRAVYLNTPVSAYAEARLDEQQVGFAFELRRRVRSVLERAGVQPVCDARGDGLPTCLHRTLLRLRDGRVVLAVRLAATERPDLLQRLAANGPRRVQLTFPRQRSARLFGGDTLGAASTFEVALDPFGAVFLELVDR